MQKDIRSSFASRDPRTYGHKQLSRMTAKLKDRFEM
ncbi:MAG: OST-HTH/LOTUS domain-containing protein [Anaerolineales bacterium]